MPKKTLTAFSILLWHNITGQIREGQQALSLDNRVLFLKVETSKTKFPILKVKSMKNSDKNWSGLLQQKLAMLFIIRSVNSTTMKLSSSNIIFQMISLQHFALQWVILQSHLTFGSVSACSFRYMLSFLLASGFYFYIFLILQ